MRGWPANERIVRVLTHGAAAWSVWAARVVDRSTTSSLDGVGAREVRYGEPADPEQRWSGELGALQDFRGAAHLAANPVLLSSGGQALPGTSPPVGNAAQDLLRRTQSY